MSRSELSPSLRSPPKIIPVIDKYSEAFFSNSLVNMFKTYIPRYVFMIQTRFISNYCCLVHTQIPSSVACKVNGILINLYLACMGSGTLKAELLAWLKTV